jgi:hypothetical protein
MMQHAQDGRNGSPDTFGAGYPAPMRIALRKLYLAKTVALSLALVAFGAAIVVFVLWLWLLLLKDLGPIAIMFMYVIFIVLGGLPLIVIGLYYLVYMCVWTVKGRTGIILDAEGYTDATTFRMIPVRILWGNVLSIATKTDGAASVSAYVRVNLRDDSVFQSYSSLKRGMTHMRYVTYRNFRRDWMRRRSLFHWDNPGPPPSIEAGLWRHRDVIMVLNLPVDAQYLASLMNSYLKAWRKEHRRVSSRQKRIAASNPANGRARSSLAGGTEDAEQFVRTGLQAEGTTAYRPARA